MELKSRIVMEAAGVNLGSFNGELNDEIIRYFEERAKGGCALISPGITVVDEIAGIAQSIQPWATNEKYLPGMVKFADAMHRYDTKAIMELGHPGRETVSAINNGNQPVAPSAIPCPVVQEMPHELTKEEIAVIVSKFARGAELCKRAGIDGVELHAAHGYLIQQFMSPWSNKRMDEYGGSFENRMRFVTEIIHAIQNICGRRYPILVRMVGDEFVDGGLHLDECVEIARYLEKLGVAALDVSCSTYLTGKTHCESQFYTEGWRKNLAKTIKANVSIPVIGTNTIKHPQTAEALLQEGVSDYVGVLRSQIADPQWGIKAKEGKEDMIRPCIGCLDCMLKDGMGLPVTCPANPWNGRETIYNENTIFKNGEGRKVVVIGGGPAGMQAALILAKRGFKPVLFEKQDRLGGTMVAAGVLPRKTYMRELIETLRKEVAAADIEVHLNHEATPEEILAMDDVYGVMVGSGGQPIIPPLEGIDQKNVYKATDVLLGKVKLDNQKVVVVGGSDTGLETAEFLCEQNQVTLIEMMDAVGVQLFAFPLEDLLAKLDKNGVSVQTSTMLKAVNPNCIEVHKAVENKDEKITADAVVLALGVRPYRQDWSRVEEKVEKFTFIGDSNAPGNISKAMKSANDKAFVL